MPGYFNLYRHKSFLFWSLVCIFGVLLIIFLACYDAPEPTKQQPQSPIQNQISTTERLVAIRETIPALVTASYSDNLDDLYNAADYTIAVSQRQLDDEKGINGNSPFASGLQDLITKTQALKTGNYTKESRIMAVKELLIYADRLIAQADPAAATYLAPRDDSPSLPVTTEK